MAAHSTGTSSSSLQQQSASPLKKLMRVKSIMIAMRMTAPSPRIMASLKTRSIELPKGAKLNEMRGASAVKIAPEV
jgi:hypothetical protein